MKVTNTEKRNGVNGAESRKRGGVALGRAGREASQVVIQRNPHRRRRQTVPVLVPVPVRLAAWNVGSITGKLDEVIEVLYRRKIDICSVQEVRWRGSGANVVGQEGRQYKIMWSGSKSKEAGVAVLIRSEWINKVVNVSRVSERIMVVKLVIGEVLVNVLSAYAPQVGRTDEEKTKFWDELFDTVSSVASSEKIVLLGDLNGHIGKEREGYETVHGGYSFGSRNAGGDRILDFAVSTNMVISSSMFKKTDRQLVTYESGGLMSTVDYILTRKEDKQSVKNVKTIPGEECVRQHRLLVGEFLFAGTKERRKTYIPQIKVWKLRDEKIKHEFVEKLDAKISADSGTGAVDEKWQRMRDSLVSTAQAVCGVRRNPPRHKETWWWNEEVAKAVESKKKLYKNWKKDRTSENKELYNKAKQYSKKVVTLAKKAKSEDLAKELDSDEGKRKVYRIAKQMARDRQDVVNVNCLRNKAGKVVVDTEEMKKVWKDYMEQLLNEENVWDQKVDSNVKEGPECSITRAEVETALKKTKSGKAPGQSGVVTEMLKASGEIGVEWLVDLCNSVIRERKIPEDWRRSVLVPVYKGKGDPLDCGSYRAIKLLEHGMKVVERVLEKRIREQVKIDDMQFGFTSGKSTTDAIFIVRQIQEKFRAKKKNLYYAFVDLEKAYDRVPRSVVEWALRKAGVEEWLVSTVMAMYEDAETAVKTENGLTDWFKVLVGLHQGSVLSPLLFIIVMDVISKEIRGGLPWELLYADDLVLMAESEEELRQKLAIWKSTLEAKGLKVNVNKTKVMFGGRGSKAAIGHVKYPCSVCSKGVGSNSVLCGICKKWVHKRCSGISGSLSQVQDFECRACKGGEVRQANEELKLEDDTGFKRVETFCYLGDLLSSGGGSEHAVIGRINKAWNKFRELKPVLCAKGVSAKVKGRVYEACVRSCMVYGGETWALVGESERKLESTEMRMVRMMCGVSSKDRCRNADLRNRLGICSVTVALRRSRLRWFGHVERKSEEDWVKRCRELEVVGVRPRGRPKKSWMDVVNSDLRILKIRREDVQDRSSWRRLISGEGQANLDDT